MTFSGSQEIEHFLSHIVTNKIWLKLREISRKKSVKDNLYLGLVHFIDYDFFGKTEWDFSGLYQGNV